MNVIKLKNISIAIRLRKFAKRVRKFTCRVSSKYHNLWNKPKLKAVFGNLHPQLKIEWSVHTRHEAIMLQKLSIMLLSSAQKITYYAFENCPLFPKLCHHNWLIMLVYCCIRPFSLMFKLQIVLNSLAGCCIRVFHFNVTALLE